MTAPRSVQCDGITGDVDLNSFNGDLAALQAMTIGGSGDLNCDGHTDGEDAQPFLAAVFSGAPPPPGPSTADMNGDGVVDAADVPLMVARLLGG